MAMINKEFWWKILNHFYSNFYKLSFSFIKHTKKVLFNNEVSNIIVSVQHIVLILYLIISQFILIYVFDFFFLLDSFIILKSYSRPSQIRENLCYYGIVLSTLIFCVNLPVWLYSIMIPK